jgi:hypothetical protein
MSKMQFIMFRPIRQGVINNLGSKSMDNHERQIEDNPFSCKPPISSNEPQLEELLLENEAGVPGPVDFWLARLRKSLRGR